MEIDRMNILILEEIKIMDKTELALKHFEEELLKDFLFREFDENDDEFILLKRYLPYTLKN